MNFDEAVFIWALINRPEDAKRYFSIFNPKYLTTAEYQPILTEIYAFVKKKHVPPSVKVLRSLFEDKDKAIYESRIKKHLDHIEDLEPDTSEVIYHLDNAREIAISRSFKEITDSVGFSELMKEDNGPAIMKAIHAWIRKFEESNEIVEMNIKEAIKFLIQERGIFNRDLKIPCNSVKVMDTYCDGGLRTKQLGILMAPTGHGKSTCLMAMAKGFSMVEQVNTLVVSNELTMEEITERMLSSITGGNLTKIMEDPISGYKGLERHWVGGLDDRLRFVSINKEHDTNEIESLVARYITLYSWNPSVVLIDYMGRMKPTVAGVSRDREWDRMGLIAQDMVRMAKRNNWLVWTAAQTNRQGLHAKVQTMEHAQGSIRHFQEAAAVISMHQTDYPSNDEDVRILEFRAQKMRQNKLITKSTLVEARLGIMEISDRVRNINEFQEEDEDGNPKKAAF